MRARLAVVLMLGLAVPPRGAAALPDHLKCYKIKDPLVLQGILDVHTPQFGPETGCTVSKAKLFCVPATKTVVSAEDRKTGPITPLPVAGAAAADDRICYKLKCPAAPADQEVTDQFGTRTLTKLKASMVCTPAVKGTAYCGDGVKNGSEACDAADLGGATCTSEGFATGTLACGQGCTLDTSGCTPIAFPATGQTTCWNTAGSVIPCAGTGHDGDVQAGAPLAYVDNGDGTITDTNTGLMWEKLSNDGSIHDKDTTYNWADAFAIKVADLNSGSFAGYADWRVPNAKELQSIVNYQNVSPAVSVAFNNGCAPACTVTTCSCTVSGNYWSSSTYAFNPQGAWFVGFGDGLVDALGKSNFNRVRAVRGGF